VSDQKLSEIELKVNEQWHTVYVEDSWTLLRLLREELGLMGTKHGCGTGECGACTVLVDGQAMSSCLTLAVEVAGRSITTIEGLSKKQELNPIQKAFIEKHAMQCGYCTPGMIMSTFALLEKNPNPTEEEIKEALTGNLCRCGSYPKIIEAVKEAARIYSVK